MDAPPPDISQLDFTDPSAVEQSLARSLPKNYFPRVIKTPTPLSRSVARAISRASPLRKAWREAQSARSQSAEEIEVLAQLGDAIKRLRSHDSEGLADTVPLGSTRRTTASVCDVGREMDLLESMDKMLLISRASRSEALLAVMTEVLDLTLKRASSSVASSVDASQASQALGCSCRSEHADACVQFDELDRCLRLCAETAARPVHRPFLLQCGVLPSLYAVLEATRRPWGPNESLRGRAVEQACAAIIELGTEDEFASMMGGAPAFAVLAELLGSPHEVATCAARALKLWP